MSSSISSTVSTSTSISIEGSNVTINEQHSSSSFSSLSSSPSSSLASLTINNTEDNSNNNNSNSNSNNNNNYFRLPSFVQVQLIQDADECERVMKKLYTELKNQTFPNVVLGFDGEWDDSNKVALLQLSTLNFCYLLHTSHMNSFSPSLKLLLEDPAILKVGVGVVGDGKQIWQSFQIHTRGLLDLRPLAEHLGFLPCGLADMASSALALDNNNNNNNNNGESNINNNNNDKILINKDYKIRCSRWEVKELSSAQVEYAALDAWLGFKIFSIFNEVAEKRKGDAMTMEQLCAVHVDTRDTYQKNKGVSNVKGGKLTDGDLKDGFPVRKSQLYYDCQLMSPEGVILCKCDLKKVNWYMDRNLGKIVQLEPLTVQLNFTPKGLGHSGDPFYMSAKKNQCVGCASTDKLAKHSIIPHSYRCHLPPKYKSRTSHDIVLLCQRCHHTVSLTSHRVRHTVASELAHILPPAPPKPSTDPTLIRAQKAGAALVKNRNIIPQQRLEELLNELRSYYNKEDITEADIEEASKINFYSQYNSNEDEKIALHVGGQGHDEVMKFVLKWRSNFLDTLKPKHMPEHWDINHDFSA